MYILHRSLVILGNMNRSLVILVIIHRPLKQSGNIDCGDQGIHIDP